VLPSHWSRSNPVDMQGDADPARYAQAVEIVAKDDNADGLMVILAPRDKTDATGSAEQIKKCAEGLDKPILASWMGGVETAAGESILHEANIPSYPYPDTAARVFTHMWNHSQNVLGAYQTPRILPEGHDDAPRREEASDIIQQARDSKRTLLTEDESKRILSAYNIPVNETKVAYGEDSAVEIAREFGYPVAVKLHSETIAHKADMGGVKLALNGSESVRRAFSEIESAVTEKAGAEHFQGVTVQPMLDLDGCQLILAAKVDPRFGPVLVFGAGGKMVEVYQDRALGLPPLNTNLARRLMERTHIYQALAGNGERPGVDMEALEQLLVRFSHLVVQQKWIKEINVNPLMATPDRIVALDARIVLHPPETSREELPRLAVRPYPTRYEANWTLKNGEAVSLRPIRPEDEPMMAAFHETLSERTVYYRYFHPLKLDVRVSHERLMRICYIDYDREIALVAIHKCHKTKESEIIGVCRLIKEHGANMGEFAIAVSDPWQGKGLGTEFLRHLLMIGQEEGLDRLECKVFPENQGMLAVCNKLHFKTKRAADGPFLIAEIQLRES
ncbi:MAG: GNAT family N-acetyltransferase, partial [Proteobacteria bacterium]|nr:GNAT family N-acetyltransferase [Pseudomonadota bacterium]